MHCNEIYVMSFHLKTPKLQLHPVQLSSMSIAQRVELMLCAAAPFQRSFLNFQWIYEAGEFTAPRSLTTSALQRLKFVPSKGMEKGGQSSSREVVGQNLFPGTTGDKVGFKLLLSRNTQISLQLSSEVLLRLLILQNWEFWRISPLLWNF